VGGSPPRHLLLLLDATAGRTNPTLKRLHARRDQGGFFFPPLPSCSPSSCQEDTAGSGIHLPRCFSVNLLRSPAWPATCCLWRRRGAWAAEGSPHQAPLKEMAPSEGGFAAVRWRRAMSLARRMGSARTISKQLSSCKLCHRRTSVADALCNEVLWITGWTDSHGERRSAGIFGFLHLLPLPASHPPNFVCSGKGNSSSLNFHLGTV